MKWYTVVLTRRTDGTVRNVLVGVMDLALVSTTVFARYEESDYVIESIMRRHGNIICEKGTGHLVEIP